MNYELVAGLEVHVELATASKIFCGCATAYGGEPNSQICPVCTGMPGTLPVLNKKVVELAVRTGLALGCRITRRCSFDRKNYFYPDLPKAYQISQLRLPICREGGLDIEVEGETKRIRIHEIHMEEDAGKLIHDNIHNRTLVDYNRCGVPLLEIVSEPDFRSADEVTAYLRGLREVLIFLGVSDCKMQEGSMRADVNVSVRRQGDRQLGVRTEMKNMNSLRAIHRAVEYEARRQIQVLEAGGQVIQQTRRWDDVQGVSTPMRQKEDTRDYRYFPEPDLPPVDIGQDWIDHLQGCQPELARAKRERYKSQYGLPDHDAVVLTGHPATSRLFEETAQLSGQPKEAANLIMVELAHLWAESGMAPEDSTVDPAKLAGLIKLVVGGKINRTAAKEVLAQIFRQDVDPIAYVKARGLLVISDTERIEAMVDQVLAANPKAVADYIGGKKNVFGFLVGQTMKGLQGKGDPQAVRKAVEDRLERIVTPE